MQDLRVTLVQANQLWEDREANFENYRKLLSEVNSDLILLPEMFDTCFSMNVSLAKSFESNPAIQFLQDLALEKKAAIYTSLMVVEKGVHFNRGVFITPEGEISKYDKRKTFGMAKEDEYFSSGSSPTVVNHKGWSIQLQICYDLRFPEISRNKISNQSALYDVLLYVANWPQ